MSSGGGDEGSTGDTGFRLFERTTVDAKTLDPEVRAELAGVYEGTEKVNEQLREEVAQLQAERDTLRRRVEGLDAENDELAARLGDLASEVDRVARETEADDFDPEAFAESLRADLAGLVERDEPAAVRGVVTPWDGPEGGAGTVPDFRPWPGVRPGTTVPPTVESVPAERVLTDFQRVVDEVDTDLSGSRYTIADFSVNLRTGVEHDNGVALKLPGLLSADPDGLTDLSFSFRPRAPGGAGDEGSPLDYDEVPALVGRSREAAETAVRVAGFTVGAVTTAPGDPGRVLDQLPSAYALAEPGAAVDLVVGAEPEEGTAGDEATATLVGTRPAREGSVPGEPEEATSEGDETEVTSADESTDAAESTDETEESDEARDDLSVVDGIGPTYEGRLYEAGIETFDTLGSADPERVADAARTSPSRASGWIEAAARLVGEER